VILVTVCGWSTFIKDYDGDNDDDGDDVYVWRYYDASG